MSCRSFLIAVAIATSALAAPARADLVQKLAGEWIVDPAAVLALYRNSDEFRRADAGTRKQREQILLSEMAKLPGFAIRDGNLIGMAGEVFPLGTLKENAFTLRAGRSMRLEVVNDDTLQLITADGERLALKRRPLVVPKVPAPPVRDLKSEWIARLQGRWRVDNLTSKLEMLHELPDYRNASAAARRALEKELREVTLALPPVLFEFSKDTMVTYEEAHPGDATTLTYEVTSVEGGTATLFAVAPNGSTLRAFVTPGEGGSLRVHFDGNIVFDLRPVLPRR